MPVTLDETDLRILQILQQDAAVPNVRLAKRVALSPSPCLRRVQRLERLGVIRSRVTLLEPAAVGLGVSVFVQVTLEQQSERALETFEKAVLGRPEVMECYLMTGDADYLLRIVVPDIAAFERFVLERLTRVASVARVRSSFALKQVKYTTALPLGASEPTAAGSSARAGSRSTLVTREAAEAAPATARATGAKRPRPHRGAPSRTRGR